MEKNAFTLIEMLLVLSVLSILILLTVPLHSSTIKKQEEKQFIELFQFDVLLIQNQASMENGEMYIRFFDDYYLVLQGIEVSYAKRKYPKGWKIIDGKRILKYYSNGTLLNPRTIVMYSEDERISLIFPLGKGRFHVNKEKRVLDD